MSILLLGLLCQVMVASAQYQPVENLGVEASGTTHVTLAWTLPAGQIPPLHYEIWRNSGGGPNSYVFIAKVMSERYTDLKVTAGATYTYCVVAYYSAFKQPASYVTVEVPDTDSALRFISTPVTTVRLGQMYRYFFEVEGAPTKDLEFSPTDASPSGMAINNIYDNERQIWLRALDWIPPAAGAYTVGIVARNLASGAQVVQEFVINVADRPGRIKGRVLDAYLQPIGDCYIRLLHIPTDGSAQSYTYQCRTDVNGAFDLANVQEGRFYAFAQAPGDNFLPQWFSNAASLANAFPRILKMNDSLAFDFTLLPNLRGLTTIEGVVTNAIGAPVENAKVSFIRKSRFISIGDTANVDNPMFQGLVAGAKSLADTSVFTDASGRYEVALATDYDYYTVAEKDGYKRSFAMGQTNALVARALRVGTSASVVDFVLTELNPSDNAITGMVRKRESGTSVQAVIIVIDSELKTRRGAGGGSTFKKIMSVVTDSNGRYNIENIPASFSYNLLAIPVDRAVLPMYYSSLGGTMDFLPSDNLTVIGSVQDVNFNLSSSIRNGIGSVFGRVMSKLDGVETPAPGTIVYVSNDATHQIVGYAISDSTGWYSVPGLPSGTYTAFAGNPAIGDAFQSDIQLTYTSFDDIKRTRRVDFIFDLGSTAVAPVEVVDFALQGNYPNPFNPSTTIEYTVPVATHVTIEVLSALGTPVARLLDERVAAGVHSVTFDASSCASGMYLCRMTVNGATKTRPMHLVK